ncbi:TonB-dependent receptor [Marinilongibacter aquaticus]|uniref:TonB-dependent receptor plug domain-containing protein n=1 Tax=Marinilongibacter aquaticus TaxID=2975157 RepID=UPI0021BD8399|nr:TonB-dependent receptor [Marinilongibacter aquaticus]UBM58429.1 TonB-dependent receptor [Marinilongibacter aquaticus]
MLKYFFLCMGMAASLYAQDTLQVVDLAAIKVSTNIVQNELKSAARNVSIISQKDIALSPVKTLDGILQYALNLDVRSRSPLGVQSDISIRGGNFDQTLVLVDGIKMNDPQTGHHSLNLPVPIEMIDHIEVLQGGASRVFGPSAFSGLINVITKKNLDKHIVAEVAVGQYGLQKYALAAGFTSGKVSAMVSASKVKSKGYTHNTAFDRDMAYGKVDWAQKYGYLTVQGGYYGNDFGASNFYHPKFYEQYEETHARFLALTQNVQFSNKLSGTLNLSYRRHNDLYDFDKYRFSNIQNVNFHQSEVYDAEWKMRYLSNFGASAFGLEWRSEGILSNRLGDDLDSPKPVKNYEEVFYSKSKVRQNMYAYLEQQKQWNKFKLAGGALLNYNSQFGVNVYPGLDASYFLTGNSTLYASANRALRFPTFTELYLNTSTVQADPNLLPEKAMHYELGYKYFDSIFNLSASLFYKATKDAIDKVKRPSQAVPTIENIDHINMGGFDFQGQLSFANLWHKPKSVLQKVQFNYAYLLADRKEEGFQSFYSLNYLRHKLSTGVFLRLAHKLNATVWYTFKKREGQYQWDAETAPVAYRPVHLLDMRVDYNLGMIGLYFDLKNALNYNYYEYGFVEQPGRWASVGLKVQL